MTDAKFAAIQRAHALGALSDDLYETARARLLEEIAATPAAAPAPAPTNREGDRAVAITALALVALLDNQHALSASTDHAVKLFNVNDGAVLRNFTHHTKTVECLALLPDGLRFVSGSNEGTARIVEIGRLC